MITSNEVDKILPALFELKKKLKPMTKDANNPFFKSKYLELCDLLENLEPLLIEEGLLLSQGNAHRHGDEYVISRITHVGSGQFAESEYKIGFNSNPQLNAGASTYGRRYSLKGLVGLAEVDDDGNTASGKTGGKKPANKPIESKASSSGFGGGSGQTVGRQEGKEEVKDSTSAKEAAKDSTPARVGSFGG